MPHLRHKHKHHTQANAQRQAKANAGEANRDKGGGTVTIDGNAYAMSQAPLTLVGSRDGVDGPYQIGSAKHKWTRGEGWITTCEIKLPGQGTGQDTRAAGSAAGHGS